VTDLTKTVRGAVLAKKTLPRLRRLSTMAQLSCQPALRRARGVVASIPMVDAPTGVSLRDLVSVVRSRRLLCACIVGAFTLAAIGYALVKTPIYRSQVLLFPVDRDSQSGGRGLLSQLGGVAALAGLKGQTSKQSQLAIETLRSREFVMRFIEERGLLPVLYARRTGWRGWVAALLRGRAPTVDDAVKYFLKTIEAVELDPDSGVVTLSIEFRDRAAAADWTNDLVTRINDQMREMAISQSRLRLQFLHAELDKTTIVGVQNAIFSLIEDETKSMMLANTERDFAFHPVERAQPARPEDFVRPQRLLLILGGLVAGAFVSVVVCMFIAAAAPRSDQGS
jgi:uncharacterized protein involved in exopolysaccharide biosynthesis